MASGIVAADVVSENTAKGYATQFLEKLEQTENELATAKQMISQQHATIELLTNDHNKEITKLDLQTNMLREQLDKATDEKNRYLRYAVELAAQCQFMVSGGMRALKIAQAVQASLLVDNGGANIPPIDGADAAELERVLTGIKRVNDDHTTN